MMEIKKATPCGRKKITFIDWLWFVTSFVLLSNLTKVYAVGRTGLIDGPPNTQYYFVMINQTALLSSSSDTRSTIQRALNAIANVVTPYVDSLQKNKPAALRTQLMHSQHHNRVFIVGFNSTQAEAGFLTGLQAPETQHFIEYFPVNDLLESILNPTTPRLSALGSHSPYLLELQTTLSQTSTLRNRPILWSAGDTLLHLSTIQHAQTRHHALAHDLTARYQQALARLAEQVSAPPVQRPIELLAAATLEPGLFGNLFLSPSGRFGLMTRLTNTIVAPEQFLGEARHTRHPTRDRYWVVPEVESSTSTNRPLVTPPMPNSTRHRFASALWTIAFADSPAEQRALGQSLMQAIMFRLQTEASLPNKQHYNVVRDVLNAINDAATEPAAIQWRQLNPQIRYSAYLQALEDFVSNFLGYLTASSVTLEPNTPLMAKVEETSDSLLFIRAHLAELSAARALEESLACSNLLVAPTNGSDVAHTPRRPLN